MDNFDRKTALMPDLIAENIIDSTQSTLNNEQKEWFISHASKRMRKCYKLNEPFRRMLNRDTTPDTAYAFINHWLKSFTADPNRYFDKMEQAGI
jgi:hypothetical protein